jgi:hypothetical protein
LDVNLEFDPAKERHARKLALWLGTVFPLSGDFAFPGGSRSSFGGKQPSPNVMAEAGYPRGPIFLAAKPAQRGTTWLKPVAKGRHLVIPYPRWSKMIFESRVSR